MLRRESIPKDPVILLSFINTKLRDNYPSLHALCDDMELEENDLKLILGTLDYEYSEELNKFI